MAARQAIGINQTLVVNPLADYNPAVATSINPPDPQGGLKSISGILGIGQQGLAIQSKGVEIQEQKQRLQQQQIETLRQQGLQNFFQNWDPSEHDGPDGTTDMESARTSSAYKSAGLAKPDIDLKLSQIKAAQLQNKQSLTNLNADNLGQLGRMAQSLSADDDVKAGGPAGVQKVSNAFENFSKLGPDAARVAQIYSPMTQHAPPGKLVNGIMALASQTQDVSAQQAQTNPQQFQNAAGEQLLRNRATGAVEQQPGAPIGSRLNPATPVVAGQTVRQTGTGNADVDTSNNVVAAQRDARQNIDLTHRIDQLAEIVNPGALPAKISAGLGALGLQDVNQARTELEKDLGRLRGGLSARAGSDQRAAEVLTGLPTATTPTQTIHQAMDVTRGTAKQDLALGALREKAAKATGGQMNGFQGDYAHAVSAASPLMHEFLSLSPQDQVGFYQRNFKTKEQAKAFRDQAQSVKKLSPDVIGQ